MTTRTQITMDADLRRRARARAIRLGISLAEYVRRVVARDLGGQEQGADVSAVFDLVAEGPETDIARDKNRLLADAVWAEHLRKTGPGGGPRQDAPRRRRPG